MNGNLRDVLAMMKAASRKNRVCSRKTFTTANDMAAAEGNVVKRYSSDMVRYLSVSISSVVFFQANENRRSTRSRCCTRPTHHDESASYRAAPSNRKWYSFDLSEGI
jgi:hypothetical protein